MAHSGSHTSADERDDDGMVRIDGSHGEGGGQILRTSLALAALQQRPVEVRNIRAGRSKPGMAPQHLAGVEAFGAITDGRLAGAKPRSGRIAFRPGAVTGGDYTFDIAARTPSAGATTLLLQALLPALARGERPSRLTLRGGTHVSWSPPFDYLEHVFLPAVGTIGVRANLELRKAGWYPRGGGEIRATIEPSDTWAPLRWTDRGSLARLRCISGYANLPAHVGKRQASAGTQALQAAGFAAEAQVVSLPGPGTGTIFFIAAEFEQGRAGFSSLGKRGKPSEKVAREACTAFLDFMGTPACVDAHLADQLVLYLALADGPSRVAVEAVTEHLRTNAWAVQQFRDVRIAIEGELGEPGVLVVEP
ncbi:MAG: RNA 3'-terminal phosphate cyclase [Armatimonadota bacterium]